MKRMAGYAIMPSWLVTGSKDNPVILYITNSSVVAGTLTPAAYEFGIEFDLLDNLENPIVQKKLTLPMAAAQQLQLFIPYDVPAGPAASVSAQAYLLDKNGNQKATTGPSPVRLYTALPPTPAASLVTRFFYQNLPSGWTVLNDGVIVPLGSSVYFTPTWTNTGTSSFGGTMMLIAVSPTGRQAMPNASSGQGFSLDPGQGQQVAFYPVLFSEAGTHTVYIYLRTGPQVVAGQKFTMVAQ